MSVICGQTTIMRRAATANQPSERICEKKANGRIYIRKSADSQPLQEIIIMLKMYEVPAQIHACYDHETETFDLEAIKRVSLDAQAKAVAYICVIKNLAGEAAAVDAELKRLKERSATIDRNKQSLTKALLFGMQALSIEEIDNGVHKARRCQSPLRVDIVNEEAVPASFKTEVITVKIDKKGIADAIKATGEVPEGVEAHRDEHLRIS